MVTVPLPILLSWLLEFFELLTQFTSGCLWTGSLSTRARHNSYGSEQSTVLPREIQIAFSVYIHPWLNLHSWGTLVLSLTKNSPWKIILPNSPSRVITSSVKYVQFGIHLHKLPSKPWSMLSSAHASILQTASSMGQARTSLTVSSRSLTLLHVWSSKSANTFDPQNRQIRSDLVCNSTGPPLASNPIPCPFQAQFHHEQLPGWSSTGVLDRALPFREWHSSEAQPSVIIPGPAPGSSISEGTIGSQRFLRLLTTAMESASCRYPTSPWRTSTF